MGLNSLTTRNAGDTILDTFFNDFKTSLSGDFVGRNSSGVPESGQNLGTLSVPWGTVRANAVVIDGDSVDTALITAPPNRVVSGKVRSTSNQPAFITPNGAALSLVIDATPTPLQLDVNGANVSVSADITVSSLTAAPGSGNTALVNDTDAADQHDTRLWGEPEHRKKITIDTVGANISALVGKYAAFMIDNGSATEYFLAYVESATVLSQVRRGYFYDSSLNPKNRIVFSNNDTITLLRLGWVFVENNGTTADVTYNNPVWSFTSPSGPATGDYWYDLQNQVWKRYDGAAFQIISRTLIGVFANSTTACVGARCIDFYAKYDAKNELALSKFSTEIVKGTKPNQKVNVAGRDMDFGNSLATWNITTDLATAADMYDATEQASRMYYLYLTDQGDTVISDISPYFRGDLCGEYHPHNPWRCVGLAYNDGSSDLQGVSAVAFPKNDEFRAQTGAGHGSAGTNVRLFGTVLTNTVASLLFMNDATNGATATCYWPGSYDFSYSDISAGNSGFGITKNGDPTVSPPTAFNLMGFTAGNAGDGVSISAPASLKIGDVVRPQDEGNSTSVSDSVMFSGIRVA